MPNAKTETKATNGARAVRSDDSYTDGIRKAAQVKSPFLVTDFKGDRTKGNATLFEDIAKTTLPVDFRGRQVTFEAHGFEDDSSSYQAMALVHRAEDAPDDAIPLVRVHSGCVTGDIFHSLKCDCYAQLQLAIERVLEQPLGIILYMPHHEGRGIGLVKKLQAYALQEQGLDTVDANVAVGAPIDSRDFRLPANILHYLGYPDIRLMTNNPMKVSKLAEHGINVVDQARSITPPSEHNERYLKTKRDRMDHIL
ncbi:MAG: GTP cyclohydrolase II [Pseudomonadota bacterium]